MGRSQKPLLVLSLVLGGFLASSPSFAAEPDDPSALRPAGDGARIRALLLAGRGFEARAAIADRLASELAIAERAAYLELYGIGSAWGWKRPPRTGRGLDVARATTFQDSLALARAELAQGAFVHAAARLDTLVPSASDFIDYARVVELRSLAYAAVRDAAAPAPVHEAVIEPPPERPVVPKPRTRWYGWQTLIADGVALTATPFSPAAGAALYLTGAPFVHVLNGNGARAGASMGARVGLPLGGGLAGGIFGGLLSCLDDCDEDAALAFGALGFGGGILSAAIVDAALIAKEPRSPSSRTTGGPTFRPSAVLRKEGGFDLGVVGTW